MYKAAIFPVLLAAITLAAFPMQLAATNLHASTSSVPPYVYQNEGELSGLAIEIIRELERRLDLPPIDIHIQPWKRALRDAEDGRSNFVFMSGPDSEREEWGDYMSTPIIVERYKLYRLKTKAISLASDYQQASAYRIGTERGCLYGHGILRKAIDQKFFSNTISSDTEANLNMLLSARVDVIAGDERRVLWNLKKMGLEGKIVANSFSDNAEELVLEWPTYIVFSKKRDQQELKSRFEKALREFKQSESYLQLLKKYQVK
ncbi:transporter substrate-binding domain-containing protein [uncultured Pseudoteredinibacter sp.]|uniref:substrate-binding periplasmic protein n=1 Tax=uncultured Pseudoteredinibacter sp. TaxID=1641701 RepID=UPI00262A7E0E|nr:transporter substrate-binding domain-containing protein [uncultured Pseudoteredinibacter sp.]